MNKIGETFPIRLSSPILIGESVIVPAGTSGSGDIVHASKSSFGGKPGELVLAVRWLDHEGIKIPLRSLKYMATSKPGQGKDNTNTAAAIGAAVGIVAMFITGGEVNIAAGTIAFAKTAAPVTITRSLN